MARFAEFLARLRGGGADDQDQQRLSAILSLNRELAKATDRRQLLVRLVDEAVTLFAAERGFVCVPIAEPPGFAVEVARSFDRESVAHPERKLSSTICKRVLAGQGVFSADAQEGDLTAAQSVADLKLRSVLAIPLTVGDAVLGGLYLDHRFHSKAFREQDLPWLQAFADQAAIVLHLHALLGENRAQKERLQATNHALAATVQAQQERLSARTPVRARGELRHAFATVIGESPALLGVLGVLDSVVDADFPVLLWGESGTGKEVVARALHDGGARKTGPFVGVNLAAIQPTMLESELFGHEKGSFTGADRARLGLFRQAQGGTLFLDEVCEMDLELQARLLRAIEERQVRPVGSDRSESFDVRLVAATNRDPRAAVQQGRLREDLYYRLAVVSLRLPPLRERIGDAPLLARHFLAEIAANQARSAKVLPDTVAQELQRRAFAGNLRELRNLMQRLVALAGDGPLPHELPREEPVALAGHDVPATFELAAIEAWAIQRALRAANGNKAEAARLLGIARRTLYSRLAEQDPDAAS
jgi:transcriptional regulator with GAF, ATPase, and Fis domain